MSLHDHRNFTGVATVREREWLIPCAVMTAALGAAAVALMPAAGYSEIPPYFDRFLNWALYSFFGLIVLLGLQLFKLWRSGITEPFAHFRSRFQATRATKLAAVAGMALAGIDMLFFMWIKPEVTAVAPFRADELYADIDHAIFFGMDPWRLFEGIDLTFHAGAYSFLWAVAIMATLVWLFAQRPTRERSASLLSYFALWSIFGPIGQLLGSAAGPIFYRRIGLGDRFLELETNVPEITQKLTDYLWNLHVTGEPAVGAGISAMPSLHIATVAWIFLVFRGQGSRLTPVAALFAIYIYALSVALGWHYAIDGLVGAAGAIVSHWFCASYLDARGKRHSSVQASIKVHA